MRIDERVVDFLVIFKLFNPWREACEIAQAVLFSKFSRLCSLEIRLHARVNKMGFGLNRHEQ
jgi:hypothetical protein